MMCNGKAGVALSITTLALLAYSILALYGMEYLFDGNHFQAIGIWLVGSIILSASTYYMCKSKANRNKRNGLLIEIPSMIVAIIILFAGSIPFTMFVSVIRQEKTFVNSITETANHVRAVDSCYQVYANNRISQYEKRLISYNYKNTAIRSRVNSLKRRLIPRIRTPSLMSAKSGWAGSIQSVFGTSPLQRISIMSWWLAKIGVNNTDNGHPSFTRGKTRPILSMTNQS